MEPLETLEESMAAVDREKLEKAGNLPEQVKNRQKWVDQDPGIMGEVAQRRALGQTTRRIGKELGIREKEVGKYLRKPEVRKLVEQYYLATVSLVPHVYTTLKEELTRKPEGEFDREMRLKASDRVAQISGLLQTRDNSKNVFFQQIIAPTNVQIHPLVQKALMELAGRNEEGERVIEGEVLPEEEIVWEGREIDK